MPFRRGARLAICAALLACVCCARHSWVREASTQEDLAADRGACLAASGNDSGVMNLETSLFVDACLKERGWRQIDGPSKLPTASGPAGAAALDPRRSFDACFERCRELTDRSKEQCFDACLGVGEAPAESR